MLGKRKLIRVLSVLGIGIYTLLFAEGFVRVLDPQPVMPRYVGATPWGVRGNIPNAHYRHITPEVNVEYRINSQGMRADRDFAFQKPAGTCRIALFGDSFFMGYELDLENTFAADLEGRLRNDGLAVEVLNFAVSGHGTAEMLRTYEGFARRFDPDVLVFEWHSTDLDDNVRSGLYRLEGNQLAAANSTYLPSIGVQSLLMRSDSYRFVSDHSELYSFLRERLATKVKRTMVAMRRAGAHKAQADDDVDDDDQEKSGVKPVSPARAELAAALLRHTAEMARAEGRKFLLVDVPDSDSRISFRTSITALPPATRARLDIVSPMDAFYSAAGPQTPLYYERGHHHLTPLGAAILADQATQRIEAEALCTSQVAPHPQTSATAGAAPDVLKPAPSVSGAPVREAARASGV